MEKQYAYVREASYCKRKCSFDLGDTRLIKHENEKSGSY